MAHLLLPPEAMSRPALAASTHREGGTEPRISEADRRTLERSLIHGMAWTGGAKWLVQVVSWASTLLVARLLTPADYGILGMAVVYLGFVQLVNEFGIGAAVVQQRDLGESQLAQLAGFSIMLGVAWFLVSLAAAVPIAAFFDEAALRTVVAVLGLSFVAAGFRTVPMALLTRDLQFRRLAGIDTVEALALAAVTLTFALLGAGYWALVLGIVASRFVGAGAVQLSHPHRVIIRLRPGSIAPTLRFGFHVVGSRIAWYTYSNADFVVVGRILGKAALGAYTIGWTIASIPVTRVHSLYQRVLPAFFSAIQHDTQALGRYLQRLTEGLAIITLPACIGIALVADQFVVLILGDHWQAAVVPLRLLAVAAALRSLTPLLGQLLVGTGHAKENRNTMVLAAFVLPALFLIGSRWGTSGVAWAWLIGHPLVIMTNQVRYALRITRTSLRSYGQALWPAASSTAVMALAVVGTRTVADPAWPFVLQFGTAVASGVAAYTMMVWFTHRDRVRAFRLTLNEIRS